MAWEATPWLVGGGAEHSAEVARLLAHAGTGGAQGIVTPSALRVTALPTPGTKVRIRTGAALLANKYPGGQQQTYVGRNTASHDVDVTATGSAGGRSDLVIARVLDPQYEGQPAPDPNTFQYMRTEIIEGVPGDTKSVLDLNLSYPAVALARIDLPSNTGTIQDEHIVDVRSMAQPRKDRHLFVYPLVQADGDLRLSQMQPGSMSWPSPNVTNWFVDVPHWAQRVRIMATWAGVLLEESEQRSNGRVWVRLARANNPDQVETQHTSWSIETEQYRNVREVWMSGDDRYVPPGLRGTNIAVFLRGRVHNDNIKASKPRLDYLSVVSVDLEFYETRS